MTLQIESLSTNAGFLKDAKLEFDPGLNCIIGARGTCKSTIIETIRFVFDCNQERVQEICQEAAPSPGYASPSQGMVRATLGAGIAKCLVTEIGVDGHDDFTIEREVEAGPRIYRNGIEELSDFDVLHNVEIYSQGDLQEIAQNESLRLELIDRPNKSEITLLDSQRRAIAEELREIGLAIRQKGREIEVRRADVRALATLRQQLNDLQSARPELPSELDEERQAALQRKQILETATRGVDDGLQFLEKLQEAIATESDFGGLAEMMNQVDAPPSKRLSEAFARLQHAQDQIRRIIQDTAFEDSRASLVALQTEFERRGRKYVQLRQEQQELNESLKKEDTLKKQIDHLSRLQNELDSFIESRKVLVEKRNKLRLQVQSICDKIHDLREVEVDNINQKHGDVVVLTLNLGSCSEHYASKLESMLAGSRIRGQDDVAREIAEHFHPSDVINIVESSDSTRLANTLDRDLSQMARVVSYLMDRQDLYELESIVFNDTLDITLYDHGTPKPIGELSKGQMATALLPLILRPAPYPLIFDQPEDDLDNSFIFQTLVRKIQHLKTERQLIFVTHNANIPVLGDADSVIVMEMESPTHVAIPALGSVDEMKSSILSLLEGGSEAFQLRHERYKGLLKDADIHGTRDAINR